MATGAQTATAHLTFSRGEEIMRQSVGLAGVEQLFDQHYESFGFDGEALKKLTIADLLERTGWHNAIDAMLQASQEEPDNLGYKHVLALALEHIGQIAHAMAVRREIAEVDPSWFLNNISIGRLSELSGLVEESRIYYAEICTTVAAHSLALARSVAVNGPQILNDMTLRDLQGKLKFTSGEEYDDMTVSLATGFICLAKDDRDGARRHFGLACLLAKDEEKKNDEKKNNGIKKRTIVQPRKNYDEWSLAYARTYLLGLSPKGRTAVPMFVDFNDAALSLACVSSHRLKDENSLVLNRYSDAATELLAPTANENYRVFQSYRIAQHGNKFYAIPNSVAAFRFVGGRVLYSSPDMGSEPPKWVKVIPKRRRLQIKYGTKKLIYIAIGIAARIPGVKPVGKLIWEKALDFYIRRHEIKNAIVDNDFASLQKRIAETGRARRDMDT
ncbi:MAG: tetratricopeptide repeat protein [Pseudolabrys sp.]